MSRSKFDKRLGRESVTVLRKLGLPVTVAKAARPRQYGYSVEVAAFRREARWDGRRSYHWYESAKARDQAAREMKRDKFYEGTTGENRPGRPALKLYRDLRLEQR